MLIIPDRVVRTDFAASAPLSFSTRRMKSSVRCVCAISRTRTPPSPFLMCLALMPLHCKVFDDRLRSPRCWR